MVLCMHILETRSLNYSETFDENFSVSTITSLFLLHIHNHQNAKQSSASNPALQEKMSSG